MSATLILSLGAVAVSLPSTWLGTMEKDAPAPAKSFIASRRGTLGAVVFLRESLAIDFLFIVFLPANGLAYSILHCDSGYIVTEQQSTSSLQPWDSREKASQSPCTTLPVSLFGVNPPLQSQLFCSPVIRDQPDHASLMLMLRIEHADAGASRLFCGIIGSDGRVEIRGVRKPARPPMASGPTGPSTAPP